MAVTSYTFNLEDISLNLKNFLQLVFLAAIWGASYLFIRIAVEDFGAIPLTAMRSIIATITLAPLVFINKQWDIFKQNWKHIFVVALISTALPFSFMTITTQFSSAGFAAILNALTPIFSAIIAWLWLKQYLSIAAVIGIILSFLGVIVMVSDTQTIAVKVGFIPVLSGLAAAALYGYTGNYSGRFLVGVAPISIAAGCQFFSSIVLFPVAYFLWPSNSISATSWASAATLGILCTSIGYVLFFQLIERVGATKTLIVTYLIPVFAIIWGMLFLGESVSTYMLIGSMCILTGITLTSGILKKREPPPSQAVQNDN